VIFRADGYRPRIQQWWFSISGPTPNSALFAKLTVPVAHKAGGEYALEAGGYKLSLTDSGFACRVDVRDLHRSLP